MFDNVSRQGFTLAISPAVLAADNTPVAFDCKGFEALTLELAIAVGGITFTGTNKIEFVWTHSDDDSTYTAVTAADLIGAPAVATGGIIKSLVAAHATAAVYKWGYVGGKRYHKLLADFSGTHATGTGICAVWAAGHPHVAPVA